MAKTKKAPLRTNPEEGIIQQFSFARVNGELVTNVPQLVVHHSPSGYEIGYGGSGPADLALNILEYYFRGSGKVPSIKCYDGKCTKEAWALHQTFKAEKIATLPQHGGSITLQALHQWIQDHPLP